MSEQDKAQGPPLDLCDELPAWHNRRMAIQTARWWMWEAYDQADLKDAAIDWLIETQEARRQQRITNTKRRAAGLVLAPAQRDAQKEFKKAGKRAIELLDDFARTYSCEDEDWEIIKQAQAALAAVSQENEEDE